MAFPFDLGFLGGGQLARMSIQAAQRMGLRCISLDPGENTPASQIAAHRVGNLDDADKIAEILRCAAHVTLENEFIPADAIRQAFQAVPGSETRLVPGVDALATIQDKLRQRQALEKAGVPTPRAVPLEDVAEVERTLGYPMVLKARFGGYDGKGTRYARNREEMETHRPLWQNGGWLAESFVPFVRELAAMVFVDANGFGAFPTVETVQENHVCSLVFPARIDASEIAIAAVEAVGGKGLFGVEMFELADGSIQINELAPRPHNTGHYTLDWGGPSQFDLHVRLACRYRVADFQGPTAGVCMANLLGQPGAGDVEAARRELLEKHPGARFHWYGKAEAKPGRKMGHINLVQREDETVEELRNAAESARETFYRAWTRSS